MKKLLIIALLITIGFSETLPDRFGKFGYKDLNNPIPTKINNSNILTDNKAIIRTLRSGCNYSWTYWYGYRWRLRGVIGFPLFSTWVIAYRLKGSAYTKLKYHYISNGCWYKDAPSYVSASLYLDNILNSKNRLLFVDNFTINNINNATKSKTINDVVTMSWTDLVKGFKINSKHVIQLKNGRQYIHTLK